MAKQTLQQHRCCVDRCCVDYRFLQLIFGGGWKYGTRDAAVVDTASAEQACVGACHVATWLHVRLVTQWLQLGSFEQSAHSGQLTGAFLGRFLRLCVPPLIQTLKSTLLHNLLDDVLGEDSFQVPADLLGAAGLDTKKVRDLLFLTLNLFLVREVLQLAYILLI